MAEASTVGVRFDHTRKERTGFDEAVFCPGKSAAQIAAILDEVHARDAPCLLTRLDSEQLDAIDAAHRQRLNYDPVSRTGFFGPVPAPRNSPEVTVVTAGSTDVPVAREAARTLHYYGRAPLEIFDVGVAGLWRLLERETEIRAASVVIVAAGMDAALPSVIGGLAPGLVIAVPTSTGYGVAQGGRAALDAVLSSCAPGVAVVNIDNGFGAACAALRALRAPRATSVAEESRR